jgi:hypothetical protein
MNNSKLKKCIFILSCWRSGTSWLEDILGKNVDGSRLFGHEQQILPLITMMKTCYNRKGSTEAKRKANLPFDDISNETFHEQFGYKFHKVLNNTFSKSEDNFEEFSRKFMKFILSSYENDCIQVVEKSPENLCPDVFNTTLDLFSDDNFYTLVYLYRDFKPYLASCYEKFVKKGINDLEYYKNKWIQWHTNAVNRINNFKPNNLYVIDYNDILRDPSIIDIFCLVRTKDEDLIIRDGTKNKWKESQVFEKINNMYEDKRVIIEFIESEIERFKIIKK